MPLRELSHDRVKAEDIVAIGDAVEVQIKGIERKTTDKSVERLMGNKPELRFEFIQERAEFAAEDVLDV